MLHFVGVKQIDLLNQNTKLRILEDQISFDRIACWPKYFALISMGRTGEATDQDILAPDVLPHPPQTSWAR